MLGQRSPQLGMFSADQQYLDMVGEESFYGFLPLLGDFRNWLPSEECRELARAV